MKLAEQVGDEGARRFAKAKTWNPVFDGTGRALIQGPDQVYLGSDELVHVVEAKGGNGQLGHAYGSQPGSDGRSIAVAAFGKPSLLTNCSRSLLSPTRRRQAVEHV